MSLIIIAIECPVFLLLCAFKIFKNFLLKFCVVANRLKVLRFSANLVKKAKVILLCSPFLYPALLKQLIWILLKDCSVIYSSLWITEWYSYFLMFLVLAVIYGLASVEDSGFVSFAPYAPFLFEHLCDPHSPLIFYRHFSVISGKCGA